MNLRPLSCLLLVSLLPLLGACRRAGAETSAAATREFSLTGVVQSPLHDGQVVIAHEDVPGFMPAMTMPFYIANETEAARLTAGDRVRFRFVVGETSRAQDFEILGHETASAKPDDPAESTRRVDRLKEGDTVPLVRLVDQDGAAFTAADFADRFTIVTFIFTRCPVPEFCPATITKCKALQNAIVAAPELRDRVHLATVTLDPAFDRPAILKAYGEAFGADFSRWRFLTGDTAEAGDFARAFSVYAKAANGTLDHSLCTALIGPDARVIEFWRGNAWQTNDVLATIRAQP